MYPPPRILNEHWCIYYCLQIPPRENWFQYVHRVYTTAIDFPCITPLIRINIQVYSLRIQAHFTYKSTRYLPKFNSNFFLNSKLRCLLETVITNYIVSPRVTNKILTNHIVSPRLTKEILTNHIVSPCVTNEILTNHIVSPRVTNEILTNHIISPRVIN